MTVAGAEARLDDGALASSVLAMDQAVRNLIELGADPVHAIGAATTVPADLMGDPNWAPSLPGAPRTSPS